MTVLDRVLTALSTVRDPELDEPVTKLGFVASCEVSAGGHAEVHLRLPTYFCAPNFAFLMVADAYDAVSTVDGVGRVDVVLDEHFAADAINEGVAARAGFARTFAGEAVGELDALRADFLRKAVLAGTDQVCRPLLGAGLTASDLATMTIAAVPTDRGAGPAATPAGRTRTARRRRRPAAAGSDHRSGGAGRGGPVAPAAGTNDQNQPGRQHRYLPRNVAGALRHRGCR